MKVEVRMFKREMFVKIGREPKTWMAVGLGLIVILCAVLMYSCGAERAFWAGIAALMLVIAVCDLAWTLQFPELQPASLQSSRKARIAMLIMLAIVCGYVMTDTAVPAAWGAFAMGCLFPVIAGLACWLITLVTGDKIDDAKRVPDEPAEESVPAPEPAAPPEEFKAA